MQIHPTGTRVRYTGTDARNAGATGTVVGMHASEWLHTVEFDAPLSDEPCPFTGKPITRGDVAPYALEALS